MASQIDITGGIHYFSKAVPGQRLALHALKNEYKQDIVADDSMFNSYSVKGSQLIVEFAHTDGGLVIAESSHSKTWPNKKLTIGGEVVDPSTVGKLAEWYKMPLLSTQFRDNVVFQGGMPITFWGSLTVRCVVELRKRALGFWLTS